MTTYGIDNPDQAVAIDYTNWRGERSVRRVVPWDIYWGSNEWHPVEQWLMRAFDVRKRETRTFALAAIHSWQGNAVLQKSTAKT